MSVEKQVDPSWRCLGRFRFGTSTLLAATAIVFIVSGVLGRQAYISHREGNALQLLRNNGSLVVESPRLQSRRHQRVRHIVVKIRNAEDVASLAHLYSIRDIRYVTLKMCGDSHHHHSAAISHLADMKSIRYLGLSKAGNNVLKRLHSFTHLKKLILDECTADSETVEELAKALPGCTVYFDPSEVSERRDGGP